MKKLIFLLILIISTNTFAATSIINPELSNIINPELSNIIAKYELCDAEKDHLGAAAFLLAALNLTNSNAQQELNEIKHPFVVPYALILHYRRLVQLGEAGQTGSKLYACECREVIDKFKKQAEGKSWEVYNCVYEHLLSHYFVNRNNKMIRETLKEAVNYDPRSRLAERYIDYIFYVAGDPINKQAASQVEKIIKKHKNAGIGLSPGIALKELVLWQKTGHIAFRKGLDYLEHYYKATPKELERAITITRDSIDPKKPEQIKEYKNALITLAIKQPSDKTRIKLLGLILKEIKEIKIYESSL